MAGGYKILYGTTAAGARIPILVNSAGKIVVITRNKGYYATSAALASAHPTATAGDFAIVGATDTVWVWDTGTGAWVNSGLQGNVISFNGRTGAVFPATNDYTWAQINKATSSIADITTKSHTALTDIGSNAHSVIDNHIASVANPHSVTKTQVGLSNVVNLDLSLMNLDPFFVNGNGFAITAGEKGWIRVPRACNITGWEITLDQIATFVADLWKDTYANYPPTDADSMAFCPISSGGAIKAQNLAIVPVACAAGDLIKLNVDANDNAKLALIKLIATAV